MLRFHSAKAIKEDVEKELKWFSANYDIPDTVQQPPPSSISKFQHLLYSVRYGELLSPYAMSPKELSMICVKRWVSGDYISWLMKILNNQSDVYCLYINDLLQRDPSTLRRFSNGSLKPEKLLFAVNVGRSANGCTYLGTDEQHGAHWTICLVDIREKIITYGDSLAWPVPDGLIEKLHSFITVCDADFHEFSIQVCHHPRSISSNGRHCCGTSCAKLYPLQTCMNICGIVVMVMAAVACFNPNLFSLLSCVDEMKISQLPQVFLTTPSKYSGYLRRVVAAWFAYNTINAAYVVPHSHVAEPNSTAATQARSDQSPAVDQASFEEPPATPDRATADDISYEEPPATPDRATTDQATVKQPSATPDRATTDKATVKQPSATPDRATTDQATVKQPSATPDRATTDQATVKQPSATPDRATTDQATLKQPSATPDRATTDQATVKQPSATPDRATTDQVTVKQPSATPDRATTDQATVKQPSATPDRATTDQATLKQPSATPDRATTDQATVKQPSATPDRATTDQVTVKQPSATPDRATTDQATVKQPSATPDRATTDQAPVKQPSASPDRATTDQATVKQPSATPDRATTDQATVKQPSATPDRATTDQATVKQPSASPDRAATDQATVKQPSASPDRAPNDQATVKQPSASPDRAPNDQATVQYTNQITDEEGSNNNDAPVKNKRYECNYCHSVFSRNSSLERHLGWRHPNERIELNGPFRCQNCAFQCHKILDLRKHLSEMHNLQFETKAVYLDNNAGERQHQTITTLTLFTFFVTKDANVEIQR